MRFSLYSLTSCCCMFTLGALLLGGSAFSQSSDVLDLDDFDSEDDFVGYLLEILGEEDESETIVSSVSGYKVTSTTSSSATIIYTPDIGESDADTFYVQVYTDAWDDIDTGDDAFEGFAVEREISPTYNNGVATLNINNLLPGRTYYMVVGSEKNTGEEIVVTTKDLSKSMDTGTLFLTDVLFDWDEYSSYMGGGLYNAYFLGMLSDALHDMSKNRQGVVIRGMYKNIKAIPQTAFLALGLDYHGFVGLLKDASTKTDSNTSTVDKEVIREKVVGGSVKTFVAEHEDLDITWQVFPSKEVGKKWVVFRTNFVDLQIARSTWHMDTGTIHACEREQCRRFGYLLEDNMSHSIHVNIVHVIDGEYEGHDEVLNLNL